MLISRPSKDETAGEFAERLRRELTVPARHGRVCGNHCVDVCVKCGKTDCDCMCSLECSNLAERLTSDPNFPIEEKILPFVFEMSKIEAFTPCWSCEGHNNKSGELWKMPRVWFYCTSDTHLRLLYDGLAKLYNSGKLHSTWGVKVSFSDADNPNTTYAIEADSDPEKVSTLDELQKDASVIAENFSKILQESARLLASRS